MPSPAEAGPQADSTLQLKREPGLASGKNCKPTCRSRSLDSPRKPRIALVTESHLLRAPPVASSIDPEESSIMYIDTLRGSAAVVCVTQAALTGGGASPWTSPVVMLVGVGDSSTCAL